MKNELRTIGRYTFCGIRFVQSELTIGEDILLAPHLSALAGFKAENLEEWYSAALGILKDTNGFDALLSVLLKPYEPTFLHRFWNTFNASRRGIALRPGMPGVPVSHRLKGSEVATVLLDFFIFNAAWTHVLPITPKASESAP